MQISEMEKEVLSNIAIIIPAGKDRNAYEIT